MWISVATNVTIPTIVTARVSWRSTQSARKVPDCTQDSTGKTPWGASYQVFSTNVATPQIAATIMKAIVTAWAARSPIERPSRPAIRQPTRGAKTAMAYIMV